MSNIQVVYRIETLDGELLYIGSGNPARPENSRIYSHVRAIRRMRASTRSVILHSGLSAEKAKRIEARLIQTLNPPGNTFFRNFSAEEKAKLRKLKSDIYWAKEYEREYLDNRTEEEVEEDIAEYCAFMCMPTPEADYESECIDRVSRNPFLRKWFINLIRSNQDIGEACVRLFVKRTSEPWLKTAAVPTKLISTAQNPQWH